VIEMGHPSRSNPCWTTQKGQPIKCFALFKATSELAGLISTLSL